MTTASASATSWWLSGRTTAAFIASSALLILAGALSYRQAEVRQEQGWWVAHTHEVMDATEEAASSLKDAENGQRGFLLTGEESLLEPYRSAAQDLGDRVERLYRLTADNPVQHNRLDALAPLLERRLAQIRKSVEMRRGGRPGDATQSLRTDEGLAVTKEVEGQFRAFKAEEARLLRRRLERESESARSGKLLLAASALLGLTTFALGVLLLNRNLGRRIEAEHVARNQTALIRSVVDNISDGVVVADGQGKLVLFNPMAQCIHGIDSHDLPFEEWPTRYHLYLPDGVTPYPPGDLPLAKAIRGESVDGAVLTVCQAGTAVRRISVTGRPLLAPGGRHEGGLIVCRDVTKEWAATETLSESRARLESQVAERTEALIHLRHAHEVILDSAGEGIYGLDPDGITTFVNPAASRMLGWPIEELIGKPQHQVLHHSWEDGSPYPVEECPIYGSIRRGTACHVEDEVFWRKDGTSFAVEYTSTPIRDQSGEVAGAVVVFRDITDRKNAALVLDGERRFLKAMLDNISDGIVACDAEGVLTLSNRAAVEFHGQALSPLPADRWPDQYDLYRPDGRTPLNREEVPLFRALRGERVRDVEMVIHPKGGTARTMVASGRGFSDVKGRNLGAVVVMHDVTERKSLEAQLRQAQKMEAFGQLAGGVAHDFNNLLSVIMGYSQMILLAIRPDDPNREPIEEIYNAGERASMLTRQLLVFSRKQVVQPRVLDLNAVVASTGKMLGRLVGEDVDLTTVLAPGLDRLEADPGQVEQVVMNLVVNARDAMPEGGRITIETANVDLDESYGHSHTAVEPGRYVLLAVSDTGCGMSEEVKQHIFEPFFTTKEVGKGTGLGLATVFGIVKQSGGHVWVYSEVGRGTTFKVYLPSLEEFIPRNEDQERPKAIPTGTETILLVEDEKAVRAMTRLALQANGYTLLEAASGGEAIRLCEGHPGPIHLLVSDVVMPQMGGRQLADQLAALRPEMRVLFVSGYTDDAVVRHGVLQAEVAFLQKPFSVDALTRKVRAVLDGPGRTCPSERLPRT